MISILRYRLAKKKNSNEFGNAIYKIRFDEMTEEIPTFGAKYHFKLEEQVDIAEFLVYFPVLEMICKEQGLKRMYSRVLILIHFMIKFRLKF